MKFPALASLTGIPAKPDLCRHIEHKALGSRTPREYLYTSGRPGRYNPRDIECLYASEDPVTAAAEYERYRDGRTTQSTNYWIRPQGRVLDLENAAVLTALKLTPAELFAPWRALTIPGPTSTQDLGLAIAAQHRVIGIRFPSDAARERGFAGFNYAFFKAAVQAPDSLVVFDDNGNEVSRWP